jgi:hypothetical protein
MSSSPPLACCFILQIIECAEAALLALDKGGPLQAHRPWPATLTDVQRMAAVPKGKLGACFCHLPGLAPGKSGEATAMHAVQRWHLKLPLASAMAT